MPLPGGKRLFLGPGQSGQINNKAVDHPPLVALVESGDLEIQGGSKNSGGRARDIGSNSGPVQNRQPGKNVFRSGDG